MSIRRSVCVLAALFLSLGSRALQAQTSITASPSSFSNLIPSAYYTVVWTVTNNTGDPVDYTFSSGCALDTYEATIPNTGHLNVTGGCLSGGANGSGSFTLSAFAPVRTNKAVTWTTGASRMQITSPGGTGVSTVTVHSPRPVVRGIFTPQAGDNFDTTTTKVELGSDAEFASFDQVDLTSLARYNHGMIEVEIDSAHQLTAADTQKIRITRCISGGTCAIMERTLILASDNTPYVDMTAMPLGVSGGIGGTGFGPGLTVSGLDVQTGFATPAYISVGAARSAALVYSTRTSYPRARVAANVTLPWPAGTPDSLKVVLFDSAGVRRDSVRIASPNCSTGAVKSCRVVLQADYAGSRITGGISRRWFKMEVTVKSSGSTYTATDSAEVVLVDRRDSPYGSGWWPADGARLVGSNGDRILVSGDGSATIFRGYGDSLFLPPPGGTGNLIKTASGFELRARGSTAKVVFDTAGRVVKSLDGSGNRDSVAYDGSGRVATLVDPIGKTITFHYSAAGKLDSLVSLPGTSGHRTTRVTIDTATNQLRYDSLSSPGASPIVAKYVYQTYDTTKGTAQLLDRFGRFGGDSVHVVYDTGARNRPIEARLLAPKSGDTIPVITYKAAELQGWRGVRSRDSVYQQVSDTLGRWTRGRLNRWGGAELVWDQVGTLARSAVDPVGRRLWVEGRNPDSSRVYTDYDALGRVSRTYVLRSGLAMLRLDSLVYDASSRVSKHIDSRGKVDSVAYDSAGRTIYHRDPSGAITRWTYQSDGQVATFLPPNTATALTTLYDATFHNAYDWLDGSGQETMVVTLDSMGRTMQEQSQIRTQLKGTVQWQARRTDAYLDAAGRTDSTVLNLSAPCGDPCDDPTGFSAIRTTKPTRDSLGRTIQLQIVGANAVTESYDLDRLGRVIGRGAPGGGRDSTVYDVAGNAIKVITRRGDTLTTWYDTRGRADSTRVPGYGTIKSTYGGPQDQLTRLTVSGFVDSLGGVNPDRAFVYDQRGRLVTDSLWTGSVGRAATHAYDTYERPTTLTDAMGTWTTQYDTTRGLVSRLIMPLGDSLNFSYDSLGRATGTALAHGSASHLPQEAATYSGSGELLSVAQSLVSGGGFTGYNGGTWQQVGADSGANFGVTLIAQYTKQDGSGAGTETQVDSTLYDGLGRLKSWKGVRGSTLLASETYAYDGNGNLTIGGTTPSFASGSNRLLSLVRGSNKSVYTYDAAGNLTQRDDSLSGAFVCSWTYGYNALDQLVSVRARASGGSTQLVARYAYDVTGARVARRVYSATCSSAATGYIRYAVTGGQVEFETDSAATTILRRYEWAPGTDNLLGVQVGSSADSMFYAVKDKLGSIRAWTRKDGTWRWAMRYRPYGTGLDSTGTALAVPYRWTGREYDPETGFYFNRARYYDAVSARFTQEDPVGLGGGSNLYAYTDGHPLAATDPSGMLYAWSGSFDPACSVTTGACYTWDGQLRGGFNDPYGGGGGSGGGGWTLGAVNAAAYDASDAAFVAMVELASQPTSFEGTPGEIQRMSDAWDHILRTLGIAVLRMSEGDIDASSPIGRDLAFVADAFTRLAAGGRPVTFYSDPVRSEYDFAVAPDRIGVNFAEIDRPSSGRTVATVMIHEYGHYAYHHSMAGYGDSEAVTNAWAVTFENVYRNAVGACPRLSHPGSGVTGWRSGC